MSGPLLLPTWKQLAVRPQFVETMLRYLEQIACILRPGSVNNTDQALRAFAGFLVENATEVTCTAQVTRRHIEDYKPWLAKRPGQNKTRVTSGTLAHRLGTLRMFFVRIDEWGWDEAPARVPMIRCSPATCPARTIHCPSIVLRRPAPATRTQTLVSFLEMSNPAHRACTTSISPPALIDGPVRVRRGEGREIQESDARARRHHSTVPVEALSTTMLTYRLNGTTEDVGVRPRRTIPVCIQRRPWTTADRKAPHLRAPWCAGGAALLTCGNADQGPCCF